MESELFRITVECIPFGVSEEELRVLLVPAEQPVSKPRWSIPAGEVRKGESFEEAADRLLLSTVSTKRIFSDQIHTVCDRENRNGPTVCVSFFALINLRHQEPGDAGPASGRWHTIDSVPPLPPSQEKLLHKALQRLRTKLKFEPIGFYLLPPTFKLHQLRKIYEIILGREIDREMFRRKIWDLDLLIPLEEIRAYRFNKRKYFVLKEKGFYLEV